VIAQSVAYPGKEFEGEIVFISPRVDVKTRTIKIRVNVENKDHLLKFGMFVTGKIVVTSDKEILVVPEGALATLNDTTVVFVPMGEDEFAVRSVVTGRTSGGLTEIRQGLSEGERVVTHGSFQLKSELLKGSFEAGHAH